MSTSSASLTVSGSQPPGSCKRGSDTPCNCSKCGQSPCASKLHQLQLFHMKLFKSMACAKTCCRFACSLCVSVPLVFCPFYDRVAKHIKFSKGCLPSYVEIYTCMHTHIHAHRHAYIHIHIQTHIYICIYRYFHPQCSLPETSKPARWNLPGACPEHRGKSLG